ncbi:hypothetical protein CDL12_22641 [Handroanthus impetiginosus]|uniref:Uncharacterized protein n=1 Tax=Handroanthus impetiginosus TaxID=429701 RepID=A0A2G9GHQ3_9LAMI|nr:hypothetical protein CDL12_22641 [Handroanthus impetiginosus]
MPSGSKKRKAAKKKKENQTSNHLNPSSVSTHAHGGDDVKHHDDKESDAGEVSSSASQDHQSNKNSLIEEEEGEIEEGENISNPPSVEGVKIEVAGERNILVEEESVIPVKRAFKIEDVSDEKDERFEHDETRRKTYDGGSSGSSNSSSSDDESHGIESNQAVVDIAPVVDSIEVADSLSGKKTEAIHSPKIEEAGDSATGPRTVESAFTENEEKRLGSVEDNVGVSEASKDAASQREEAIIQSVENIVAIPDTKECVAQESDDQLTMSTNAPVAAADDGSNAEEDSGVTEPLLAPAPRHAQRTSWKSCCGLFEVFTGSGR